MRRLSGWCVFGALTVLGCASPPLQSNNRAPAAVEISAATDSAFSTCARTPTPLDTVTPASEPFGVVDPKNSNHLVIAWTQRARFGTTVIRAAVSFDAGGSWSSLTTLPFTSCGTQTPFLFRTAGDPWLAVGTNGVIYASALSTVEDSASGIVVTTSVDGGRSWRAPVIAMQSVEARGQYDNSSITVDPSDPAVAFVSSIRNESNPDGTRVGLAVVAKTVDAGQRWSPARAISARRPGESADLPHMVIDPRTRRLFVLYTTGARGSIWLVTSADGGESWTAPSLVATLIPLEGPPRFPGSNTVMRVGEDVARITIDPRTGRLFVVFVDRRFSGGDYPQIDVTTSADAGRTWTPVVAGLSDTTVAAWQPASAILPDGSLAFSYYTTAASRDSSGQAYPTAVGVARVRITNEGRVLERRPARVAEFPWQPGPRKSGMFLGDYHALLVVGDKLCPVYARSFGQASQIVFGCAQLSGK